MKSRELNILMITARADFGGGPEHVYRLINMLHEKINIYVACPDDYPYWNLYAKVIGSDHLIKIPHRKFRIGAMLDLLQFVKRNKINIIHFHGKGAGVYRVLSLFSGVKCIHTFHGIHTGHYGIFKRSSYLFIEKILSRFTTQYISVSESEKRSVIDLKITEENKITMIPNGTPLHEKLPVRHSNDDLYRVVSITRFDYAKNTALLIPVAEALMKVKGDKKFRFIIIGSGKEEQSFKEEINRKGLNDLFEMTGSIMNTGDYLIKSFCYISTSRWEGLPLGVLEAMSYGLPVIASAVPGNTDLVEHEHTGFLFDLNRPDEAAMYIKRLSDDINKYNEIAAGARLKIKEHYSLKKMAEETINLYNRII